jgi:hypothetical protein
VVVVCRRDFLEHSRKAAGAARRGDDLHSALRAEEADEDDVDADDAITCGALEPAVPPSV